MLTAQIVLILAVGAVGVLHTLVPDHWAPIALVARQHGWTRSQTARAAFGAGTGHVVSTLLIGLAVWIAGIAFAAKFGGLVSIVSSVALIGFGLWIAIGALLEQRRDGGHAHAHGDDEHRHHDDIPLETHRHAHRHAGDLAHVHLHSHQAEEMHAIDEGAEPPLHHHDHKASGRTALLLILGSSPMVEGIPAFFAASKYGAGLIAVMAIVFATATIATYVIICSYFADRLRDISIGPFERYGEVLSGGLIVLVGVVFLIWPLR
jgi:hypothetical protein